ncbi:superoxide dismutase [Brevundimonas vesicularis]|uniref:superoxide dismutase n=1 Tax=Brevundimonas vesicularis TaxID=41276 RepID=UPI0038D360AC
MIRKNILLAGVAGAFIFAAPALAQETTAQDPMTPPAAAEPAAQPSSLSLTPGSTVKSKDGTELGQLVGVQAGATGQELTVRGADGQVRPVPVTGIEASGTDIMVDATLSDFQSATPVPSEIPAPTPDVNPTPDSDADTTDDATPDTTDATDDTDATTPPDAVDPQA